MKVKIKFSDLRKLKDEKSYLKEKLEESNLKLDYAITNEKNLISEIKQKNNKSALQRISLFCRSFPIRKTT